jgi:hypothetical protein
MSAGSLAKAISKSGSSTNKIFKTINIFIFYKGPKSSHSKNIVVILAVMYGKGVALSDTLAIKSDDL